MLLAARVKAFPLKPDVSCGEEVRRSIFELWQLHKDDALDTDFESEIQKGRRVRQRV